MSNLLTLESLNYGAPVLLYFLRTSLLVTLSIQQFFYARKQLLLSAHLSRRNSVRPSLCLSVCHTGGSVKNGAR